MLSANFYVNGEDFGFLTVLRISNTDDIEAEVSDYNVEWFGSESTGLSDVSTVVTHRYTDGAGALFGMAMVEVDAILAERAVN